MSRTVMSPFLELDMGHRRFNRNGNALVQIMGVDREQAVMKRIIRMDHEKTKSRSGNIPRDLVRLNKMKRASWTSDETAGRCENEARWESAQLSWMECWKLGPVCQSWAVTGPVGWSIMAMGRWALGIGPGAWATSLGLCLTCLGAVRPVRDVWHARASFYTLKLKENHRKIEREPDCTIQDQEWCEDNKKILSILEVCDKTMMEACSGGAWSSMIREGTRSRWIMYKSVGSDLMALNHGLGRKAVYDLILGKDGRPDPWMMDQGVCSD
ncbi:hypothetical protein DY000_02006669 [Brassica cretica]|uniref:Uncharacterized protein n=1 Tax=Brassica cretica TaxID=69181 RepID=A0ABQ7C8V8_BRACR|nr:hypothetical protein DY000_02006669 [Brassica cretica]